MDVALKTARVALVGNPNSGKTALFNALTGAHQKVANYAGVTVERKEGLIRSAGGRTMTVLDLPGTYSLRARSPDEEVTRDAVLGKLAGEEAPDVLVCRCKQPLPEGERAKIALFCNVRPDSVIPAYDLKSIYEAPMAYHRAGLDRAVLDAFQISPAPKPDLRRWEDVMDRLENAEGQVRIAVVGNPRE